MLMKKYGDVHMTDLGSNKDLSKGDILDNPTGSKIQKAL